jgi:cytochrome c oxidase cbb3-type subunit I
MRAMGGLIFFSGACIMLFNVTVTIRRAVAKPSAAMATAANI